LLGWQTGCPKILKLSTTRKGKIGELIVVNDLLYKGYEVYLPVVDDNGIDLIVSNGRLIKSVQCKSHYNPQRKHYSSIEINTRGCQKADIIAIPLNAKDCICYIRSGTVNRAINIAFEPSLNNQKKYINWYEDFLEFPWKEDK
jgi:hypothetical protein